MTGLDEDLQSTSQRLEQMTLEGEFPDQKIRIVARNAAGAAALGTDEKWPKNQNSGTKCCIGWG